MWNACFIAQCSHLCWLCIWSIGLEFSANSCMTLPIYTCFQLCIRPELYQPKNEDISCLLKSMQKATQQQQVAYCIPSRGPLNRTLKIMPITTNTIFTCVNCVQTYTCSGIVYAAQYSITSRRHSKYSTFILAGILLSLTQLCVQYRLFYVIMPYRSIPNTPFILA